MILPSALVIKFPIYAVAPISLLAELSARSTPFVDYSAGLQVCKPSQAQILASQAEGREGKSIRA
jgi:hypothetical protein